MRPSPVFIDAYGKSITETYPHGGLGVIFDVDNGGGLDGSGGLAPYYNKVTSWIITPRVRASTLLHAASSSARMPTF